MNFLDTEISNATLKEFAIALNSSQLIAFLLHNRGVQSLVAAKKFLKPSLTALYNPFLFKDMDAAVERIKSALISGEKILIYGDEDVDGISSTAILMKTLQNLGGQVSYVIPNKKNDGIGLKEKFIRQASEAGISLIITVDCASTNFAQVEYASQVGIDVIITDHHETLETVPGAIAIINPKWIHSGYPFKKLSGAGVAYKISQAVAMKMMGLTQMQWFSVQKELISLVMLGTIGDRVPLIDENRIFVKFGLEILQKLESPWVTAILEKYPAANKKITMSTILTHFIPLLSAGESKNGCNIGCELLLNNNLQITHNWVADLFSSSQDWFLRARNAFGRIKANHSFSKNSNLILLIEHETDIDVLSYCASKLKDILKRPVILIGFKDDCVVGEARAPKGFDLMKYLKSCDALFLDYGGHKCAAGFSVLPQHLPAAISKLNEIAAKIPPNTIHHRHTNAEVELTIDELTYHIFQEVTQLSPFGEGNPAPLFLVKNVELQKYYDGYRINNYEHSLWATRRIRHQLNFPIGISVKGDVEFFIEDSGRGYISRFQIANEEDPK